MNEGTGREAAGTSGARTRARRDFSSEELSGRFEVALDIDHPLNRPVDPRDIEGLGATTLKRLGVSHWRDFLAVDRVEMQHTQGIGAGKLRVLDELIERARGMLDDAPEELLEMVDLHPIDDPIDPTHVDGLGAGTLSGLGVVTWRDLLELEPESLEQLPGVGARRAEIIRELTQRARAMAPSAESGAFSAGSRDLLEARGLDLDRPAHEHLARLSNRAANAIRKADLSLLGLVEMMERGDLRSLDGVGEKSCGELRDQLLLLAREGVEVYLFGDAGAPSDVPEAIARVLEELDPCDQMLVHRRYRDGLVFEALAVELGQTRERARQRLAKVIEEATPVYASVISRMLGELTRTLNGNLGVLGLERALALAGDDIEPWHLIFALDIVGLEARIIGGQLFCVLPTRALEELSQIITMTLREIPHRALDVAQVRGYLSSLLGLELGEDATCVLMDDLLAYDREDGARSWRNRGLTESTLYAAAIQPHERPLTRDEIAFAYREHTRDVEPPDVRTVYTMVTRTEAIYRVDEGYYLHRDHLPIPESELIEVAKQAAAIITLRDEVVDVAELRGEFVRRGILPEEITSALLHDAISRRDDIKVFVGSTTEVAPAGRDLERTTLTEHIASRMRERGITTSDELFAQLAQEGFDTSLGSVVQSLNKSEELAYLGNKRYIHRSRVGVSEEFLAPLLEDALEALPADAPIGASRLLSLLTEHPASCFLLAREDGADIFWGLLREHPDVAYSVSGHILMRAAVGQDPLSVAFEQFIQQTPSFLPREFRHYLDEEIGVTECNSSANSRVTRALQEGRLTRDDAGVYTRVDRDSEQDVV